MGDIDSVELVEKWVSADLSSATFSQEEQDRVLDDIDELEEHLTVWGRRLTRCVQILSDTGNETIYRRREGDLRSYFIRAGIRCTVLESGSGRRRMTVTSLGSSSGPKNDGLIRKLIHANGRDTDT
jgi:hypothetical protein